MKTTRSPAKRTTKADRTRAAILASARRAFADHGYDGAGVRLDTLVDANPQRLAKIITPVIAAILDRPVASS